jgi:hypothetical protein
VLSSDNQVHKSKNNALDGDIMAVQQNLVKQGRSRSFKGIGQRILRGVNTKLK